MLRKFKIQFVLMLTFVFSFSALSFTPTQQQIEQFKNMPRAQQEALARQMGVDLSDLQLGNQGTSAEQGFNNRQSQQIYRTVNEQDIAARLAEQSAAKDLSKELKPFGYSLFGSNEDSENNISFAPADNIPVPADYVMGPGDSIKVQLFGKESGDFELFINSEGTIQIPELGPMSVVGLTYQELKQELIEKYSQQVIGVTPHITMGALRTIQVYIVGEAYRPGAYSVSSLSSITHALFASGGVSEIGSLRNIELKRAGKTVAQFDLYDLLVFGNTENDKRLQQGDVVFIPPVQKLVSVDGNVRRPAIYEAKENETLDQLMHIAGGLLPSGAADKVQIARNTPQSGLEVKTVNLIKDQGQRTALASGDYISVPEANSEFTNAITIAGAYATPGLLQWYNGLTLADVISANTLLKDTDLDYGLILRKDKFSAQSEVIQFEPSKILEGQQNLTLQKYDQITFFNKYAIDEETDESLEKEGDAKDKFNKRSKPNERNNNDDEEMPEEQDWQQFQRSENKLVSNFAYDAEFSKESFSEEQEDYLQKMESASFTDRQQILKATQTFSRKRLLEPVIARLKNEGTQASPVKLAEITGQVKFPGVYPVSTNGTVRDLILAGGGLVESAYIKKAELSRNNTDQDGTYRVQHINVDLLGALMGDTNANLALTSKDTLSILRTPDWYDNRQVELVGEVVFPGTYQIRKNETLSQLIARAGGFTSEASVKAAIFTREELKEREKKNLDKTVEELRQQIISSNVSGSQNVKTVDYEDASVILEDLLSVEPVGRLVINLPEITQGNRQADVRLKDGDKLFVPSISSSVSVIGEVFVPTTHILEEHISMQEYIDRSGGLTERADDSKIYIVKANGSVKVPNHNFWFDGDKIMLEPGDTIVVPRDVVNYERLGLWQTITQVFYQSAIALVAIGRL